MTTDESVAAIMAIFADVEALADQAKTKLDQLPDLFKAINDNGDAGNLISKSSSLRAKAMGLNFKADVWVFHSDLTEAAKLRGLDGPIIESGGPGR